MSLWPCGSDARAADLGGREACRWRVGPGGATAALGDAYAWSAAHGAAYGMRYFLRGRVMLRGGLCRRGACRCGARTSWPARPVPLPAALRGRSRARTGRAEGGGQGATHPPPCPPRPRLALATSPPRTGPPAPQEQTAGAEHANPPQAVPGEGALAAALQRRGAGGPAPRRAYPQLLQFCSSVTFRSMLALLPYTARWRSRVSSAPRFSSTNTCGPAASARRREPLPPPPASAP